MGESMPIFIRLLQRTHNAANVALACLDRRLEYLMAHDADDKGEGKETAS